MHELTMSVVSDVLVRRDERQRGGTSERGSHEGSEGRATDRANGSVVRCQLRTSPPDARPTARGRDQRERANVIKDDLPAYLERLRLDDPRTELGLEALLSESNETLTGSISESEAEARRFFKGL